MSSLPSSDDLQFLGLLFGAIGTAAVLMLLVGRRFESPENYARTRRMLKQLLVASPLIAAMVLWRSASPEHFDHWLPVVFGAVFWGAALVLLWTALRFYRRRGKWERAGLPVPMALDDDEAARTRNDLGVAGVLIGAPVVATWMDIDPFLWVGALATVVSGYPALRQVVRAKRRPARGPSRRR